MDKIYGITDTKALYLAFFYAFLASIELGWNLGAVNNPQPFIKCWINQVQIGDLNKKDCENSTISEDEIGSIHENLKDVTIFWSLFTAIYAIGAAIGSIIGGPISDKFGRKKAIFFSAILAVTASLILGFIRKIDNYIIFVLARTLIGVNTGLNSTIAPVYLYEIAPKKKRGFFGASFQIGLVSGILLSQVAGLEWLLGTNEHWPKIFLLGAFPAGFQILIFFFVEESPTWLIDRAAVVTSLSLPTRSNASNQNNDDEESLLQNIIQLYKDPPVRSAMWTCVIYIIIKQISGITAINFYSGSIFNSAGIPNEFAGVATVGLGLLNVIASIVFSFIVDKVGRMLLFFWSLILMAVSTIIATILISFSHTSNVLAYLSIIPFLIYIIAFNLGTGPIPWMIASETIPPKYKSGVAAVGAFTNWTVAFLVGLLFPILNELMDQYVFIIFSVSCLLGAGYVRFFGVESKRLTVVEVQDIYRARLRARRGGLAVARLGSLAYIQKESVRK